MIEILDKSIFLKYWHYILTILIAYLIYNLFKNKQKIKHPSKQHNSETHITDQETENEKSPINKYYKMKDSLESYDDDNLIPTLEDKPHIPYPGPTITLNGGINTFYEIVNDRRSVRNFSKRSVDVNIIRKCIQSAGTSPSGAHTQPWTFCLVSNQQLKQEIRQIIEQEEYLNYIQRMSRQWITDLKPLKTNFIKEYLTDAPYLILVFKQMYGIQVSSNGKRQQHYYYETSTAISVGILLCAIQSAGLNSLVTTPLNCGPALRELLDRPKNEKLLVLLPVGYAADDCTIPDLQRKKLSEILVEY